MCLQLRISKSPSQVTDTQMFGTDEHTARRMNFGKHRVELLSVSGAQDRTLGAVGLQN